MNGKIGETLRDILSRLARGEPLSHTDFVFLLRQRNEETAGLLAEKAVAVRKRIYGDTVFIRGLIEISSYCKNDCL